MQAKYKLLGTQGSILMYNNTAYKFALNGSYEGTVTIYPMGMLDVNVVSVAVFKNSCEIAINVGDTLKRYKSELTVPEILGSVTAVGGFYTAVLSRNIDVKVGTIRQLLIVCHNTINPLAYLAHLKLKEII